MSTEVSLKRTDYLSRPKPIPPGFLKDRRSVYWIDRAPPLCEEGVTKLALTARLEELASPKPVHPDYVGHRRTPVWPVSGAARVAGPSDRISYLAAARPVHPDYRYDRSIGVSTAAKNFVTTPRLYELSKPRIIKPCNQPPSDERPCYEDPNKTAERLDRITVLAEAKRLPSDYKGVRPVTWHVCRKALNASASMRLRQLARPKSGRLKTEDHDPYKVSLAARTSKATPRLQDLSMPIPRKVRQKKTG